MPNLIRRLPWRGLGLSFLSTVIALAVGEVIVRAGGLDPAPREASFSAKVHRVATGRLGETMGIELRPGASNRVTYPPDRGREEREVRYRINSLGFRDRELTAAKVPGEYRILCLGDSFTFGTGVPLEDAWPRLLEGVLTERRAAFTTANLGIYSLNVLQQEAWLRRVLAERQVEADHVLWCLYINDASGPGFTAEEQVLSPEAHWIQRLGLTSGVWERGTEATPAMKRTMAVRRVSALADFLAYRLYGALHSAATMRGYLDNWSESGEDLQKVRASLERVAALCRNRGLRLSVCMYPSLIGSFDENHPYAAAHEALADMAAELELEYFDLRAPLAGLRPDGLWAHLHDQHPNRAANERVARYLADQLFPKLALEASAQGE